MVIVASGRAPRDARECRDGCVEDWIATAVVRLDEDVPVLDKIFNDEVSGPPWDRCGASSTSSVHSKSC
jgi:hypothetical protein